ncbi:hypothetical protein JRQ81_009772 [Phrynocephalus forsythii]|uniref:Actin-related protein T2 n=1 Tax=Phrynocephalus forsythii TaxID=171643 RepID=A0A9Q0XAT8_9SAUR|nr:hypothetical protein JRQ81_009772 [Phrynocephalus forsythii]
MSDRNALHIPAIVIDNGTKSCKAGISGSTKPRSVTESVVGRFEENAEACYVGKRSLAKKGILLNYPIKRGIITHWEDMEELWDYIYTEKLKVEASTRPVLLSEPPLNPLPNREKTTELMFEQFGVPALYLSVQATLAVYALARITGLVVDSGDGVTHTVPVYDGYCLAHGVVQLDLAGKDIAEHLTGLLWKSSYASLNRTMKNMVKDLKEKFCYVASDPQQEPQEGPVKQVVKLPHGKSIKINFRLHQGPEILFQPKTVGVKAPGLPAMVTRSIAKCDKDVCRSLYENVILSGGSSLFPYLGERLFKEIEPHVPKGVSARIRTPSQNPWTTWIGGSVITHLTSFEPMWFTRGEYEEFGAAGIHRKCF